MAELNAVSSQRCIADYFQTPWWRRFVAISPQQCIEMELTSGVAALMLWTGKVMQDAEWDHKPKLRRMFPSPTTKTSVWHTHGSTYRNVPSVPHPSGVSGAREAYPDSPEAPAETRSPTAERPRAMTSRSSLNPLRPSAIIAVLLAAACSRPDDVQVRLTRMKNANAAAIDWITVFSGADKRSLELSPGETGQVVLRPDGERPDVILTFRVDGVPRSWQGPPLRQGLGICRGSRHRRRRHRERSALRDAVRAAVDGLSAARERAGRTMSSRRWN
jgi:hypothetical protein